MHKKDLFFPLVLSLLSYLVSESSEGYVAKAVVSFDPSKERSVSSH